VSDSGPWEFEESYESVRVVAPDGTVLAISKTNNRLESRLWEGSAALAGSALLTMRNVSARGAFRYSNGSVIDGLW